MLASVSPEPDRSDSIIYVGQDEAGHWLVQDGGKRLEGRFISFATALSYANAERQLYHARVEIARTPLSPLIPYKPAADHEYALARAA